MMPQELGFRERAYLVRKSPAVIPWVYTEVPSCESKKSATIPAGVGAPQSAAASRWGCEPLEENQHRVMVYDDGGSSRRMGGQTPREN